MPDFINLLKRIPFLSASYRQRDFHFQMSLLSPMKF